jgi:hypothetical protein
VRDDDDEENDAKTMEKAASFLSPSLAPWTTRTPTRTSSCESLKSFAS